MPNRNFIYRKSDGLFIHTVIDTADIGTDNSFTNVSPKRTSNADNIFEIEEYPRYDGISVINYADWNSANKHPYFVENAVTLQMLVLNLTGVNSNTNGTYVRYKYAQSTFALNDKTVGAKTYLCWVKSVNGTINTSYTLYTEQDGIYYLPTDTIKRYNASGVEQTGTISVSTTSLTVPANSWIIRDRKEVPFENTQTIKNSNIPLKLETPSSLAVQRFLKSKLGVDDTGKIMSYHLITIDKMPSISDTTTYNNNINFNEVNTATNKYLVEETNSTNVLGINFQDIEIACDFKIGNASFTRQNSAGQINKLAGYYTSLVSAIGGDTATVYIPIYAPCKDMSTKIDNDLNCIIKMMETPTMYNNYTNPITEYIDKRIESFISEIQSAANGDAWDKYY